MGLQRGAVNTIVNRDGMLTGHNTDGSGFLRALREVGGLDPARRRVLILGAGGAARGVVLALVRQGVGHLTIANRTLARAQRLAELALAGGVQANAIELTGPGLDVGASEAALIVNCTSVGMSHGPDEAGSPLSREQIPSTALVNDLVYNPLDTPPLARGQRLGREVPGWDSHVGIPRCGFLRDVDWSAGPVDVMLDAATRAMASR